MIAQKKWRKTERTCDHCNGPILECMTGEWDGLRECAECRCQWLSDKRLHRIGSGPQCPKEETEHTSWLTQEGVALPKLPRVVWGVLAFLLVSMIYPPLSLPLIGAVGSVLTLFVALLRLLFIPLLFGGFGCLIFWVWRRRSW